MFTALFLAGSRRCCSVLFPYYRVREEEEKTEFPLPHPGPPSLRNPLPRVRWLPASPSNSGARKYWCKTMQGHDHEKASGSRCENSVI